MPDATTVEHDEASGMTNLSKARTGIPGVVWVSTRVGRHGPCVRYYEKPGMAQPSFSVSIEDSPVVLAGDLPERVIMRISPKVIEWVKLNRAALLALWNEGDAWMDEQVSAVIDGLVRLS